MRDNVRTVRDDDLERGRHAYARRAWPDAHDSFSRADEGTPLAAGDLELLATSAYMLGRDDEWQRVLERAHQRYLDAGAPLRAVSAAFWIGMNLALRGETAQASGWLGRNVCGVSSNQSRLTNARAATVICAPARRRTGSPMRVRTRLKATAPRAIPTRNTARIIVKTYVVLPVPDANSRVQVTW